MPAAMIVRRAREGGAGRGRGAMRIGGSKPAGLLFVSIALLAWAACGAGARPIGILTYNIYWGGQPRDPVPDRDHEWLRVIEARNPDIILIQEANGWLPEEQDLVSAYADSLSAAFPDQPPYSGHVANARSAFHVVLLTRFPVLSFEAFTDVDIGGQVVQIAHAFAVATLWVNGEEVHAVAVHFKPGPNREQRELEARALLAILDGLPRGNTVWIGGDFNSYSPVDIAPGSPTPPDYAHGADPPEIKGWEPIGYLLDRGYQDAFRSLHPTDHGYTQDTAGFILGGYPRQRVDVLLRSPGSPWRRASAETVADSLGHIGSDHYAVFATFDYDASSILAPAAPNGDAGALTLAPGTRPGIGDARAILGLDREQQVSLIVWTLEGRRVRRLGPRLLAAGRHGVTWDGRDDQGRRVGPGLYWLRASGEGGAATLRWVLLDPAGR